MTLAAPFRLPARIRPAFFLAPESIVLALICLLDLATTLFWVSYREAAEGNPIMAFYLHRGGASAFIAVKIVLFAVPLFVTEWARQYRPRFVQAALRVGIAAYLSCYTLGVCQVNRADCPDSAVLQTIALYLSGDDEN